MTAAQGDALLLVAYGLAGLVVVAIFVLAFIAGNQR
jgi:hypothetical protein